MTHTPAEMKEMADCLEMDASSLPVTHATRNFLAASMLRQAADAMEAQPATKSRDYTALAMALHTVSAFDKGDERTWDELSDGRRQSLLAKAERVVVAFQRIAYGPKTKDTP